MNRIILAIVLMVIVASCHSGTGAYIERDYFIEGKANVYNSKGARVGIIRESYFNKGKYTIEKF